MQPSFPNNGNINKAPKLLKYIAFFMLSASVVLIVLGVYFYQKEDAFLKECKLITCKVTDIEERRLGRPVVTFTEVNGNYPPIKLTREYDPADEELGIEMNETRELYYYKKDVQQSQLKGFFENHLTSFILLIIGFTFMMDFPILLLVSNKSKRQRQEKSQFGIKDEVISE